MPFHTTGEMIGTMTKAIRGRLNYANVVATMALFIALGGSSYAAIQLPKNSVSARALKKNSVTSPKIKKSAVNSRHVKNGALLAEDFSAGQLPQGATGPQGAAGATGAVGVSNLGVVSNTTAATVAQYAQLATSVDCPAGQKVFGGGGQVSGNAGNKNVALIQLNPDPFDFDDWRAAGVNLDSSQTVTVSVWAICGDVD